MDGDLEKRKANIEHLKKVIAASQKLGIGMVTTFIGRDHTKSVEENLKLFEGNLAGYYPASRRNTR